MTVDLYHSRRINHKRCAYFKRNEDDSVGDMSVWVKNNRPTGYFYARKINTQNKEQANFVNAFEIGRTNCLIETNDEIPDIEVNDIVVYKNVAWAVTSVQQLEHLKETEFSDGEHYTTVLGLRK